MTKKSADSEGAPQSGSGSHAYRRTVETGEAQAKGDEELSSFDQLTENAESILQAANKLPPPVDKKAKNKSDKPKETN